jgi:hypothetical protein
MLLVLLEASGRAAVAAGFMAALSLIGFSLLPRAARPGRARLLLPLSLSAGALVVGWICWLAGSLIGTAAVPVVFALLAVISLRQSRAFVRTAGSAFREMWLLVRAAPGAAFLVLVPVTLSIPVLVAPLSDSDGIRYHVALPKLFLLTGKVFLYPWDATGAYPQQAEMLDLVLLPLTGGEGTKLLHFGFFLATLSAITLLVHRKRASRSPALLAAFLFAVAPVSIAPAPVAFIDHIGLFSVACAALLVVDGASGLSVGVALASALATKSSLGPAAIALGLAAVMRAPRRRRALAEVTLPVLLALAPIAVRNALATGDPVFPLGHVLVGRPIPGVTGRTGRLPHRYHAETSLPLGIRWLGEPRAVQPDEVAGAHHLLGLAALLLAVRRRELRPLLYVALTTIAFSLPFHPPTRLLLPLFLALAVFEGAALAVLRPWISLSLSAVASVPALLVTVPLMLGNGNVRDYVRGRIDRRGFLGREIPGWRAAELVNRLPTGGKVMALDFPGPYYFDRPWIVEGLFNDPPLRRWLDAGDDAEALLRRLHALDVRYLVVTPGYGGGTNASLFPLAMSKESARALVELRARLRLVGRVDRVDVWEVPTGPPGLEKALIPSGPRARR